MQDEMVLLQLGKMDRYTWTESLEKNLKFHNVPHFFRNVNLAMLSIYDSPEGVSG